MRLSFELLLIIALGTQAYTPSRRAFLSRSVAASGALIAGSAVQPAQAAPQILNTESGIKYATLKEASDKGAYPQEKDIVAIEYTGYLTSGQIFDATHAEGKKNALMFEVGGNAVIPGISEMVTNMQVGQKVQAIIPPQLAFGDKGLCVESGECLIKPGQTLVYDISLKRSAIPPP